MTDDFWSPEYDDLPREARDTVPRELFSGALRDRKLLVTFGVERIVDFLYVGTLGRPKQVVFQEQRDGSWKRVDWRKFDL